MKDQYERDINYMRISVTDRCNLRCKYCMPESGVEPVEHDEILRFDEILKIAELAGKLGIENIKITGGEPLVRKNVISLISDVKALDGIKRVTLTTNGVLLKEALPDLIEAGLDGVNISLDTLKPERYEMLTGMPCLQQVQAAIEECIKYPELKTKINVVTLLGINEDEILSFAGIAAKTKIDVRFIEMMPIGMGQSFRGYMQEDIMAQIEDVFGKGEVIAKKVGIGPAVYYSFKNFEGRIGFISALSHKFCGDCNRVRLTAEGLLKPCLQYADGVDLKEAIRGGKSEKELSELIEKGIFGKPNQHEFCSDNILNREEKFMSRIGG